MIPWGLVIANLFRHPARTFLTFASLVIAFVLFMVLNAVTAAFSGNASMHGVNRLIIDAKYSMTDNLPVAYLEQLRSIEGVTAASAVNWFGGYYRDPKEAFTTLAVDASSYFSIYGEYQIAPDVLARFQASPIGAVASRSLADKYGWSVGDRVVLRGDIWPQVDGSWDWEFEFAGTFESAGGQLSQSLFLLRWDYFDDAVIHWAKNEVGFIVVDIDEAKSADAIVAQIDAFYENSSDPTKTASEDQYTRQFVSQLGDIGLISSAILSAVFFTILLLTANTASLTFRERVPELAAMKTLGFTDRSVASLVLSEAMVLCVAGGITGIAVARALEPVLNASLGEVLGSFAMDTRSMARALALSVGIGIAIGIQPAWAARRLTIVDALRER